MLSVKQTSAKLEVTAAPILTKHPVLKW